MMRACFRPSVSRLAGRARRRADAQEVGEMRLYIQQLEERVRQLTGENERLTYELNQLRAAARPAAAPAGPAQTGAVAAAAAAGRARPACSRAGADARRAAAGSRHALGLAGRSADRAGRRSMPAAPIDLSTSWPAACAGELVDPNCRPGAAARACRRSQTAGLPGAPPPTTALSGSPRDEYDLAYGYILTGDYDLAEESFQELARRLPERSAGGRRAVLARREPFPAGRISRGGERLPRRLQDAPAEPEGPGRAAEARHVARPRSARRAPPAPRFAEVGRQYPQASAGADEPGR